jgi:hypothetical protein
MHAYGFSRRISPEGEGVLERKERSAKFRPYKELELFLLARNFGTDRRIIHHDYLTSGIILFDINEQCLARNSRRQSQDQDLKLRQC